MLPVLVTEVAWTTNPTDLPVWADLGALDGERPVVQAGWGRGRGDEDSAPQVGMLSAALDNSDGRFTPGRTGSPYYPNVTTDRRMRLRGSWAGLTYPLFDGYVERWPTRSTGREYGETNLVATDALEALANPLPAPLDFEVLALAPLAYYRLDEQPGYAMRYPNGLLDTTWVRDQSGKLDATARIEGTATSGVTQGVAYSRGSTPLVSSDDAGSLQLKPKPYAAGVADIGFYVNGTVTPTSGSGLTLQAVVQLGADDLAASGPLSTVAHLYKGVSGATYFQLGLFLNSSGQAVAAMGSTVATGTANLADDQPHHLMGVVSPGGTVVLYVDGALAASTAGPAQTLTVDRVSIGARDPYGSRDAFLTGNISHVAVFAGVADGTVAARLNSARLGYPGELAGARIDRLLTQGGWPAGAGYRVLDAGVLHLTQQPQEGVRLLAALQAAADTEGGVLFADAAGRIAFHDRAHRSSSSTVRVALGADATPVETDLQWSFDRSRIVNDLTITSPAGVVRVSDTASVARHRLRSKSLQLDVASYAETQDAAAYLLARDAYPTVRVETVTLNPVAAPDLWQFVLSAEVSDRVVLVDLPADAPATTFDAWVEHVQHDVTATSWVTTLTLSPAPGSTGYGVRPYGAGPYGGTA